MGGAASALTPCVFPILPALLAVSGQGGRRRVVGIVVGLELSFFLVGIVLAGILSSLGLPNSLLQWVAAVLLAGFALTMLVPALHSRYQAMVSKLTAPVAAGRSQRAGFTGGLLAGAPLGLVWAPCAGPILAGIAVAGATTTFTARTVVLMVVYALGMLGPLLVIGFGGRHVSDFLRTKLGGGRGIELVMGVVLLVTAALVAFGWMNRINRFLAEAVNLTSTPLASVERRALSGDTAPEGKGQRVHLSERDLVVSGYPELEELAHYGRAPGFSGITHWFNSAPVTMQELRGKVVLVDFWTYSCINCIRTFPYLKQWYADYKDEGFVLVGVHTPEFAFEEEPDNVAAAIADFDIEYPVALDPDYETWNNYYNRYWPAHYLIDRRGVLRSVHYGEGAYERTENEIRHLLSLPADADVSEETPDPRPRTPETYLGYLRADRFAGAADGELGLVRDQPATYEPPTQLPLHFWTYTGNWTVHGEMAEAGSGAAIELHYLAGDVHIVAGPGTSSSGTITMEGDEGTRTIPVSEHRLYTLRSASRRAGLLRLEFSEGVEVYSFTFG